MSSLDYSNIQNLGKRTLEEGMSVTQGDGQISKPKPYTMLRSTATLKTTKRKIPFPTFYHSTPKAMTFKILAIFLQL